MTAHSSRWSRAVVGVGALLAATSMVVAGALAAGQSRSSDAEHAGHQMGDPRGGCRGPELDCASSATAVFAPDGTLWVAWAAGGQVSVAHTADLGQSYSALVRVTPSAATLDSGADERPQLLVDGLGRVTVAYAIFKDKKYNGQILTAVSRDHGQHFSAPRSITDDGSSQRFINLQQDADGQIFAAWIDKRHVVAEEKAGHDFAGASLAFAWSTDGGEHFAPATIAHDHMCECCRLGVALAALHAPAVVFRNIFDGERDHALLQFAPDMTRRSLTRVAEDHWKLDACPHHGPSLARAADGTFHAVWFSGGGVRQGSFYAHSTDGGRTFSAPMTIGEPDRQPTRPFVFVQSDRVWLTWKEFDGEHTTVRLASSRDGGRTFEAPRTVAQTEDYSDHPLLISSGTRVFVSWLTAQEGLRIISAEPRS